MKLFITSVISLSVLVVVTTGVNHHYEDTVVVQALDESQIYPIGQRMKRQFVSATGIGQFPGFPPGWPFGITGGSRPPAAQKFPHGLTSTTMSPSGNKETCRTIRSELGYCATLRQCYPVLYSLIDFENDTQRNNDEMTLRNPELAHILRSEVAGPCDPIADSENQVLFRMGSNINQQESEFRGRLICCPNQPSPPPRPSTTSRPAIRPLTSTLKPLFPGVRPLTSTFKPNYPVQPNPPRMPSFGHRPPTPRPGLSSSTSSSPPIVSSSCGISKIVGGSETVPGKYPWMVALMNGPKQFCGGSLIDSQHVLTASHCVSHMRPFEVSRVRVLLGAHNIYQLSPTTVVRKVARLVRHRGFSHQTLHNDVAVLKLDSPVKFSDHIQPICLARGQNRFASSHAIVAGWGSIAENSHQPATLRAVTIDVWSNDKCRGKYGHLAPGGITDHMVCAGSQSRDACRGDSGGPLVLHTGNYYEQIGIVSWGIGCGRFPGVYSRVTDFLGWITKNIE